MKFESIHQLVQYVKSEHEYGKYVYRGQCQPWPLKSSLFRIENKVEREEEWDKTFHFCNWLVNNERLRAINNPFENVLAISQHHGYKTDLVDFTWDIEVAAFFATQGDTVANKPGAIWAVKWESFLGYYNFLKELEKPKLIEVKALWRLENQKGLFIRDQGGSLNRIIGSADFYFTQNIRLTGYETKRITKSFIYPKPNDLEREIERYKYIEISRLNRENNPEMFANSITFQIEKETMEIEEVIEINKWDNEFEWNAVNLIQFSDYHSDQLNLIELEIEWKEKDVIINGNLDSYNKQVGNKFEVVLKDLEFVDESDLVNRLNEYAFTLSQYPYSNKQIIKSILELIQIYCKSRKSNVHAININQIEEMYKGHFGQEVKRFGFGDAMGVGSYCMVPIDYFENSYTLNKIKSVIAEKKLNNVKIDRNIELFHFIYDIRRMFTEIEALDFWIHFVLPYQFIFRGNSSRIYLPHKVTNFGYA